MARTVSRRSCCRCSTNATSSVTRFFRSTIDRGNFGIVQRLDEDGQPIDLNCVTLECERVSSPTINRFTFNAETQRDLELELGPQGQVRKRSTLFLRYNYEDVRLYQSQEPAARAHPASRPRGAALALRRDLRARHARQPVRPDARRFSHRRLRHLAQSPRRQSLVQ